MRTLHRLFVSTVLLVVTGCREVTKAAEIATAQRDAAAFLTSYTAEFQKLYTASSEAQWTSQTHIVDGDDTNAARTRKADEQLAAFTGSVANIATARALLAQKDKLSDLQARQLESILFRAASNPQTVHDVVTARIAAETAQTEKMYGF